METKKITRILFVCLGNICRSPAAEAMLRMLVERDGIADRVVIDSAGTYGGHAGERSDVRMRRAAEEAEGLASYDYILINDELQVCVEQMHNIIQSEHFRTSRNHDFMNQIKDELKAKGFKFSYSLGWHSPIKREVPAPYQLFHFTVIQFILSQKSCPSWVKRHVNA